MKKYLFVIWSVWALGVSAQKNAAFSRAALDSVQRAEEAFRRQWIGQPLPPVVFESLDGEKWNNLMLSGQVCVLNFWFIACPPCNAEIPEFNQLKETFKYEGVRFFAISGQDSPEALAAFAERRPFRALQVHDQGGELARVMGISRFPVTMVVDPEGIIREVVTGGKPGLAQRLGPLLEQLKPDLR